MTIGPQNNEGGAEGGTAYRPTFLFGDPEDDIPEGFVNLDSFTRTARQLGYSDQPGVHAFLDTTPHIAFALTERYRSHWDGVLPEGRAGLPEEYPAYPAGLDRLFNPHHRSSDRNRILLATHAVNAAYWERIEQRAHKVLRSTIPKSPQHFNITEALLIEHDAFERP